MAFDLFTPGHASSSSSAPARASSSTAGASTANGNREIADHHDADEEDDDIEIAYLRPHAFSRGDKAAWRKAGKSFGIAVSPTGGEVAAWVTKEPPAHGVAKAPATSHPSDKAIYFASSSSFDQPVLDFFSETFTAFTTLQRVVATHYKISPDDHGPAEVEALLGPPSAEVVGYIARVVAVYLDEIAKLAYVKDVAPVTRATYRVVYHIFQLVRTLFLPKDGRGEGLLGEELLDWVNGVDPAPNNDQGNEILQSNPPWEHPAFWPYLQRCILRGLFKPANTFLRSLENHPVQAVKGLASTLASRLASLPRSHDTSQYRLDHQFLTAHRQWQMALEADLATQPGGRKGRWLSDELSEMETEFKTVVELMEGKGERVLAEANDWREALGAWGLLVDVSMTRDDLPIVASRVLDRIPVDKTILDDSIQSSLCLGNTAKALIGCNDLDIWLAAHLADLFDKLAMLPDEERFDMSLRDHFLLEYADLLAMHPRHASFWDIIVDYLYAAGPEGRLRLKEFIMHVGLDAPPPTISPDAADEDDAMEVDIADPKLEHFAKIREVCASHELEEEFEAISQIIADRMVKSGQYGIAATIYATSGNAVGMSDLADSLLGVYVAEGDEVFIAKVAELPPSLLQHLGDLDGIKTEDEAPYVFTPRLAFLAQFNEFVHARRNEDYAKASSLVVSLLNTDLSPVGIRAVLLADAVPLLEGLGVHIDSKSTFEIMRVLEDVAINAEYAAKEYIGQLQTYLYCKSARADASKAINGKKEDQTFDEALSKLEEVRLALARNLARALVFDNAL